MDTNGHPCIRIALAEDHVMFREALCREINTWNNCRVILEAGNGKELLEKLNSHDPPDLVLVDLCMPVMNGYETISALRKEFPSTRILVLSMYGSEEATYRVSCLGANGFLNKMDDMSKIQEAVIKTVSLEQRTHEGVSTTNLLKGQLAGRKSSNYILSEEELHFLRCVCSEKTYKAIAAEMGITGRHAEYLRYSLFERFKVQSRTGLAIRAIEKGLAI